MRVILALSERQVEQVEKNIIEWDKDPKIIVHIEPKILGKSTESSIVTLINSNDNKAELIKVRKTLMYKGRRHGLESPTMYGIFNKLHDCKVVYMESWRKDRPWYETGLDSPKVVKVKKICSKIDKRLSGTSRLIEVDTKVMIENWEGEFTRFRWEAIDYKRASALGINL